ncbi:MAG: hypothetical protein ACLQSR_09230 [Limisphaerales bacterium]
MKQNTQKSNGEKFTQACLASCQKLVEQIDRVRNNIVAEFQDTFASYEPLLNHVLNEADALAWQTEYPHLFFPSLALERIETAAEWKARQEAIRERSLEYAMAA